MKKIIFLSFVAASVLFTAYAEEAKTVEKVPAKKIEAEKSKLDMGISRENLREKVSDDSTYEDAQEEDKDAVDEALPEVGIGLNVATETEVAGDEVVRVAQAPRLDVDVVHVDHHRDDGDERHRGSRRRYACGRRLLAPAVGQDPERARRGVSAGRARRGG